MPYITVLEPNSKGNIYVFGDVHGRLETLNTIFSSMKPEDTAISVGDLIDRKPFSKEIILKLINAANDPSLPKIHVVSGNHERLAYQALGRIEDILLERTNNPIKNLQSKRKLDSLLVFMDKRNMGGGWLIDLYLNELENNIILVDKTGITYTPSSEIVAIGKFFASLPIIIHVKASGSMPAFHVVHADMPFSDEKVQEVITSGIMDPDDIDYALNARPEIYQQKVRINERTKDSLTAVCGHCIVGSNPIYHVRRDFNTINLDLGSFIKKHCLVLNMTKQNCLYYSWQKNSIESRLITDLSELDKMDFKAPQNPEKTNSPYLPFLESARPSKIRGRQGRNLFGSRTTFEDFPLEEKHDEEILESVCFHEKGISIFSDSNDLDSSIEKVNPFITLSNSDTCNKKNTSQSESCSSSYQASSDSESTSVRKPAITNNQCKQSFTLFEGIISYKRIGEEHDFYQVLKKTKR